MKQTKQSKTVNIGLIGLGTVGSGVVKVIRAHASEIEKKTGIRLVLSRVCVRSLSKKRAVAVPRNILTQEYRKVTRDPKIDIVVELIGGIHPAKEIIHDAFTHGKHVVTANKALLAEEGRFVFGDPAKLAKKLGFEASVCGGIPIIKSIKEGLASNRIHSVLGIVNGTCNYILSSMSKHKTEFAHALAQAQARGYAEADPKLDIEGIDSAHKLAILARLSFGAEIPFKQIHVEGIKGFSAHDIEYAKELGYSIKLLAVGKRHKDGLDLRVHPTMLPDDHPLAHVNGVYNAVLVKADQADDILFYGRGAGMLPTASAVMSDIIDIAKRISGQVDMKANIPAAPQRLKLLPVDNIVSKYYLRFQVADKPGVLGDIAKTLGKNHISILSVHQKESHHESSVPVIILTYAAREADLKRALKQISAKKIVRERTTVIRVEN